MAFDSTIPLHTVLPDEFRCVHLNRYTESENCWMVTL